MHKRNGFIGSLSIDKMFFCVCACRTVLNLQITTKLFQSFLAIRVHIYLADYLGLICMKLDSKQYESLERAALIKVVPGYQFCGEKNCCFDAAL